MRHIPAGRQQTVKRSVGAQRLCQPEIAGAKHLQYGVLNSYRIIICARCLVRVEKALAGCPQMLMQAWHLRPPGLAASAHFVHARLHHVRTPAASPLFIFALRKCGCSSCCIRHMHPYFHRCHCMQACAPAPEICLRMDSLLYRYCPLSTFTIWPVMQRARSEPKKRAAWAWSIGKVGTFLVDFLCRMGR